MMSESATCPSCGAELPADAPKGFCPRCLYRLGLGEAAEPALPAEQAAPGALPDPVPAPGFAKRDFGDYELVEEIGHGGMGLVYKARQKSLDRIVALKLLLFGPHAPPDSVKRFRAEAVATAALQHSNIVAIHEVGFCEGQHFIAMDYVEGGSMAALIHGSPLPARRAAGYVKTIAEAMHYAHERGILHRDLKPANVLIDASDQPRVTDFGLARRLEGGPELTITGQVLGSPNYMPPEQAVGKGGKVSRRTDVYALGAILYHALTGRPPFVGEGLAETMQQVLGVEPVPPRVLNPGVPADLETVCLKCLEKDPAKRYATAQMLAEELGRFLEGKPVFARPVGRVGKAWRWCRRQPGRASLIAALALVCLGGAAAVLWQWRAAEAARAVAERAQQGLRQELYKSRLAEARANRWSGRAGRRFDSLEAIRQAAAIRPTPELRNEAIACLALPDIRVQSWVEMGNHAELFGFAIDEAFERYACEYPDGSISLRRLRDHSEIMRFQARGRVEPGLFLFSHRGRFLCLRTSGKENVTVWDTARQQLVSAPSFEVRNVCFTPDEKQVVLAEAGGRIHFCDLLTGTETDGLTVPPLVIHVAVDPEGKRLAVSRESDPSVLIFNLGSNTICASLTNVSGGGFMSWSPDGQVLACTSGERIYLWGVATGELQTLEGHKGTVTAALFSHQGDLLASMGWDGMIRLWDPKLALPLVSLPGALPQNGFDTSDRRLAFGVSSRENGICEVTAARECRRLGRTATGFVWAGDFSLDGRVLATASGEEVLLWQVPLNRLVARLPLNGARSVMWHPNGTSLVASGWSGIGLWPIELSTEGAAVRAGPGRKLSTLHLERAALASDGRLLVAAGATKSDLLALDMEQPNQPRLLIGHPGATSVSISPNGKWFATGAWQGTGVKVWSTETWKPIKELAVSGSARCAFSPDGQWLLTSSGEECRLWSTDTWEARLKVPRDQAGDMPGGIALSANPPMAALLHGRDRGVKLISIPEGRELAFFDTGEPLCFSRDGGLLATTSEDHRNVLVWDLRLIRQELRTLGLDWD